MQRAFASFALFLFIALVPGCVRSQEPVQSLFWTPEQKKLLDEWGWSLGCVSTQRNTTRSSYVERIARTLTPAQTKRILDIAEEHQTAYLNRWSSKSLGEERPDVQQGYDKSFAEAERTYQVLLGRWNYQPCGTQFRDSVVLLRPGNLVEEAARLPADLYTHQ